MTVRSPTPNPSPQRGRGGSQPDHPAQLQAASASLPPLWGRDGVVGLAGGTS
jgi:hypothetical protein